MRAAASGYQERLSVLPGPLLCCLLGRPHWSGACWRKMHCSGRIGLQPSVQAQGQQTLPPPVCRLHHPQRPHMQLQAAMQFSHRQQQRQRRRRRKQQTDTRQQTQLSLRVWV